MRQQNYRGVLIETGEKHLLISFFSHGFVNNYWYDKPLKVGMVTVKITWKWLDPGPIRAL
jgi:hypothetical protein